MGKTVIIIGAGASGMAAAIAAAREGARAVILEHTDRPGKKLLATGNGKCNLTNLDWGAGVYRSEQPEFAQAVVRRTPPKAVTAFFEDLGLLLTTRNGYVYPASGQAASVLDALRFELSRLGIPIVFGCRVEFISRELEVFVSWKGDLQPAEDVRKDMAEGGFLYAPWEDAPFDGPRSPHGRWKAEAVILAAGSKAAPVTGSDGSGYELAARLGHRIIKPLPALVQLRCKEKWHKSAAGVRTEAAVTLYGGEVKLAWNRGELQFTDYGISGIPVFQISRYAACALETGGNVWVSLDLLPDMEREALWVLLKKRRERLGERPSEEFLSGILNRKLCSLLLKEARIPDGVRSKELTDGQLRLVLERLKGLRAVVSATNSFEQAQVCRGGVDTEEITPETMESKLVRGLYFAGEILDVDGICGGYNLQWAWSSGLLAGRSAAGAVGGETYGGKGERAQLRTAVRAGERNTGGNGENSGGNGKNNGGNKAGKHVRRAAGKPAGKPNGNPVKKAAGKSGQKPDGGGTGKAGKIAGKRAGRGRSWFESVR